MRFLPAVILILGLAACAGEDRASMLGIARNKPDEFAILKREPLAVPADVNNPELLPSPGSLASGTASSQSRGAAVISGTPSQPEPKTLRSVAMLDGGEQALLDKATGLTVPDPMIRERLKTDETENKDLVSETLNLPNTDKVIVPKGEYERLKALKEAEKPLNEGEPVARQEKNPLFKALIP